MKPAEASRVAKAQAEAQAGTPAGSRPGIQVSSHAVIASMRQQGIAFTADNYAVWHCYLAGTNPALKRALDIVLSNGLTIEDRTLRVLYARHFCQAREALALRDVTRRAMQTLAELNTLPDLAVAADVLARLGRDMQDMATQSEQMTRALTQSEERIAQLECCLDDARQEASTDGLTGLANRRAFDAALRATAGDALNGGSELAFLLIDIDHFKQINDRWGHPAGDEVLRLIAATLTRTMRGKDVVARYGGEEFAIILPGTDRHGAVAAAENLRDAVEQQMLPLPGGAGQVRVTISAGLSCYDHGENLGAWLARADGALYKAKNTGRNRVMFGDAPMLRASNVVVMAARG